VRLVFVLATLMLLAPRTAHAACAGITGTGLVFGNYTGLAVTNSAAKSLCKTAPPTSRIAWASIKDQPAAQP
jgi:hypothetical protein